MKKTVSESIGETSTSPPKIEIGLAEAIRLYSLYSSIKNADYHFQTCQSTNFRDYVKSVLGAQNVINAFEKLNAEIEAHKSEK